MIILTVIFVPIFLDDSLRVLNHPHTQQVSKEDSFNRIINSFPFVNIDC